MGALETQTQELMETSSGDYCNNHKTFYKNKKFSFFTETLQKLFYCLLKLSEMDTETSEGEPGGWGPGGWGPGGGPGGGCVVV